MILNKKRMIKSILALAVAIILIIVFVVPMIADFAGMPVDKNGKEIYEGDIYSAVSVSGLVGIVLYKKGRVVILSEDGNDYPITLYRGQVIGNIYENPELLEVK